jgi:hypothetical protein
MRSTILNLVPLVKPQNGSSPARMWRVRMAGRLGWSSRRPCPRPAASARAVVPRFGLLPSVRTAHLIEGAPHPCLHQWDHPSQRLQAVRALAVPALASSAAPPPAPLAPGAVCPAPAPTTPGPARAIPARAPAGALHRRGCSGPGALRLSQSGAVPVGKCLRQRRGGQRLARCLPSCVRRPLPVRAVPAPGAPVSVEARSASHPRGPACLAAVWRAAVL